MFRFLTGGESHGLALVAVIDGVPSRLSLEAEDIDRDLKRRQLGYGRGGRMQIERDAVTIASGVRGGKTLGSPISLIISNKDWPNWTDIMSVEAGPPNETVLTKPRPGHADLAGLIKYGFGDVRNVLERASARETAARVAIGAVAKRLLAEFGIEVASSVISIGQVSASATVMSPADGPKADQSLVRCLDEGTSKEMTAVIDEAAAAGETLGGVFEVAVFGVPVGLGSYAQWDRRLDGNIAKAVMSIPAIKGVEIGDGFGLAERMGSEAHDEISYSPEAGFIRSTNRAGGLEAGLTNGSPVRVRAAMKPIPTLGKPLMTVDIITKQPAEAISERSDVCAVPAASVVAEAVVAIELADAVLRKYGGDSLEEALSHFAASSGRNNP
jgi:chorismate synthase